MSDLVLAETAVQVREFRRLVPGTAHWVAVGPGAMHELERLGIGYTIPEDYYRPDQLLSVGERSRAAAARICRLLDERLAAVRKEFADGRLTYMFNYYSFSAQIDLLAARTFQLNRIIRSVQPARVWAAAPGTPRGVAGVTYGSLLGLDGWPVKARPVVLPAVGTVPGEDCRTGRYMTRFPSGAAGHKLVNAARVWLWNLGPPLAKARHACFYLLNAENKAVARELPRRGVRVSIFPVRDWSWPLYVSETRRRKICRDLETDTDFRRCFYWNGIDAYPLAVSDVQFLVQHLSSQLINAYRYAGAFFRRERVSFLLTRSKVRAVDHSVCQAARESNVTVCNWQHGAVGFAGHHTLKYTELLTTDLFLAFGRGVCRALERDAAGYPATAMPVGSPELDRLRGTWCRRRGRVARLLPAGGAAASLLCVYATTNYLEHCWYSGYEPPFSDTLFYQSQLALLRGLRAIQPLRGVVKCHPNPAYAPPPWIADLAGEESWTVVRDQCSFVELLAYADLVVLDWPSTTLLQALVTDRPLFVLTRHRRLYPGVVKLLARRAVLAEEPEDLVRQVRAFAETGRYPADVRDTAFLLDYGLHLADGRTRERAADSIAGGPAGPQRK